MKHHKLLHADSIHLALFLLEIKDGKNNANLLAAKRGVLFNKSGG